MLSDKYFKNKNEASKKLEKAFPEKSFYKHKTNLRSQTPCFFRDMIVNNEKDFESCSLNSSLKVETNSIMDLNEVTKEEQKAIINKNTIRQFAKISSLPKKIISHTIYTPILSCSTKPC